ncbi:MAG: acyl-CoA synthetase [Pseudomonas sp.]
MHPIIHAYAMPDKPACILADTGETLAYLELERRANQGAQLFRALGLKRGDGVAVLLENSFATFEIGWAAQRCGLYLTSVSTKASPADIAYIVEDADARLVIAAGELSATLEQAAALFEDRTRVVLSDAEGRQSYAQLRQHQPAERIRNESAGTDMLYSSGTTGRPKGVRPVLPDGPLDERTPLMAMGEQLYAMGRDCVYLSTSPLYHAAPLRWAMTIQRYGGTVVVMEKFDAEQALALIERYRITHSTWVPTHFVRMLKLPEQVRARYDCSSQRAVIHAAAPCPVQVKQAMIDWWGPILHEYYSGTEQCGITALDSPQWLRKRGSVGKAVLGEIHILDDEGRELPPRSIGNIYFANGPRFSYHNDPDKTRQAHNERGWATLGDIGWLDEDGFLYLTDRKSFMIISGGVNIYPQEIEDCLVTHPQVEDVAVIGAPDEEMGECVVAVVKLRDPRAQSPALTEELRRYVRGALGGVKCPQRFDFREALPRTPTGKLMKRLLRDEYRRDASGAAEAVMP